jgi:hypothetical protein
MEEMNYNNSSPFKDYIKASGNTCAILSLAAILIFGQAACSAADYWITFW